MAVCEAAYNRIKMALKGELSAPSARFGAKKPRIKLDDLDFERVDPITKFRQTVE